MIHLIFKKFKNMSNIDKIRFLNKYNNYEIYEYNFVLGRSIISRLKPGKLKHILNNISYDNAFHLIYKISNFKLIKVFQIMNKKEIANHISNLDNKTRSYIINNLHKKIIINLLNNELYQYSIDYMIDYIIYSYYSYTKIVNILNCLSTYILIGIIKTIYDYKNIIDRFINANYISNFPYVSEINYILALNEIILNISKRTLIRIFNNIDDQTIINIFNILYEETKIDIINNLSPYIVIKIMHILPEIKKYITNKKVYQKLFEYKINIIMLLKRYNLDIVSEHILKHIY